MSRMLRFRTRKAFEENINQESLGAFENQTTNPEAIDEVLDETDETIDEVVSKTIEEIRYWCVQYTEISMNAKNDLLKILNLLDPSFPLDIRSLLKTPRTVPIVDMAGGKYCSFSIKEELVTYL